MTLVIFALSTPIPNAVVATIISILLSIYCFTNVSVKDIFDANSSDFTFLSVSPTNGGICSTFNTSTQELNCSWATMPSGVTYSIEVKIRPTHLISPPAIWRIYNTATISMDIPDSNINNNSKGVALIVKSGEVDLSIEKSESPNFHEPVSFDTTIGADNFIVYKVEIINNGPSLATGIKFKDIFVV